MRNSNTYEDLMAFDLDDSINGKILTQKEINEEDYHRLIEYLKMEVLPKNIMYQKDNDSYKTYINYSSLIKYGFSLEELKYIIKYLKDNGIEIRTILYNSYFAQDFNISIKNNDFVPVFSELKHLKPLNSDLQKELLIKYKETKDINIKKELIIRNIALVLKTMERLTILKTRDDFYEDIFSEACLGLIQAIEDYNPDINYQFSTIAVKYILDSILNYLRKNRAITPLYGNFLSAKSVIEEKFGTTLEHDFSIFDYILDYMIENNQIREQDKVIVTRRLVWFLKKIYPLYKEIGEGIDYQELDSEITDEEINKIVRDSLNSLDFMTKKLYELRYGFDNEVTSIKDLANEFGISYNGIKKRLTKGLPIIREYYCKNTGDSYKIKTNK